MTFACQTDPDQRGVSSCLNNEVLRVGIIMEDTIISRFVQSLHSTIQSIMAVGHYNLIFI